MLEALKELHMQLAETMNDLSPAPHSRDDVDLKKHRRCSLYADDSTCATAFTSMSSLLEDSMTVASISTRSSISVPTRSRRGSILKSTPSKLDGSNSTGFAKRRPSRISFSATPAQVFTIESKEEFYEDMFYDQESLADFRYEALMWEAGMVDENGTPVSLIESANETKTKYDQEDEMNGSLDFDELVLDELNPSKSGGSNLGNSNPLQDVEEDKAYSRDSIKELRKGIDASDLQWQGTSELFGELGDWDDDDFRDDDESFAGDDELEDGLDNPFTALDVDDKLVGELTPKEKFELQRRQLAFHKNKRQREGHNFLAQKFNTFNLSDDDDNRLVFEPSDDGSGQSQDHGGENDGNDGDDESITRRISNERTFEVASFACEDDSLQSERSVPCDSDSGNEAVVGDTSGRSFARRSLEKRDSLRASFKSLSDVFLSTSQHSTASLDESAHSTKNEEPENRRSRLMAKMRGLRESLRSIQDLGDIDSDDDSEWGDDGDEDTVNTIDTKNLRRSLIGKHKIYSPVPNQERPTIDRMGSVNEMIIPEL